MGDASENSDGKVKVLVDEDEFFIADELERTLTEAGFRVVGPASSNEDALYLLEEELPNVATLDVNMGGVRVTPVAARLEQLDIPFALASASSTFDLAYEPVLAGAVNVGKPTDGRRLVEAIRDLIGRD